MKKHIVVLTGAGISAESGIQTFRDSDGLWEGVDIQEVATPQAWKANPEKVQRFYNERRKTVLAAQPNAAHLTLAQWEKEYKVSIITQNIDDLHERAGSSHILHLHGIITRSQSSANAKLTYPIAGWELRMDETCENGSPLRPHIVWFGEDVPAIQEAIEICQQADIFVIVGTSLVVYPAAGLADIVADEVPKFIVDPKPIALHHLNNASQITDKASTGLATLMQKIKAIDSNL